MEDKQISGSSSADKSPGSAEESEIDKTKYVTSESEPYDNAEVPPESNTVPTPVSELSVENRKVSADSEKKRKSFDEYCSESIILNFIIFVCTFITKLCRKSLTASIFTSYPSTADTFSSSSLYGNKLFRRISSLSFKLKRVIQRLLSTATIPKVFNQLPSSLLSIKTSSFGLVLMIFSFGTALVHVIERFYIPFGDLDIYAPLSAAVMFIIALMLLLNKNSLAKTLRESAIGSFIFFTILGIDQPAESDEISPSGSGACIIGTLLSLLTIFIPAHMICIFILIAIYTLIALKSPESAFISLILIIPFVSQIYTVYVCSVIIISYILKYLCGKRSFKFEFLDLFVGGFFVLTIFGGISTFGDSRSAHITVLYTVMYFVAVNILKSGLWLKRTVNTIIFSAVLLTLYSAFVFVFKNIIALPIDFTPQTDIGNADATIFASASLLGVVLTYSVFFLLSELLISKSNTHKIGLFFIAAFGLFFVFSSLSPAAKIAAAVAIILFFMLYSKKTAAIFTLLTVMLPFIPLFLTLPSAQIFNFFKSELYRVDIWKSVIYMLIGNALPENAEISNSFLTSFGFTGAGIGDGAFNDVFSICHPGSSSDITHAHNLFLQISVSFGLIGLIIFLLIVFFILQNCFSFGRCCIDKKFPSRIYNYAGMCSLIALLLCGLGEYIWYNPRVVLIFWIICAISVSAKRSTATNDSNYLPFGRYEDYYELL